MHDEVVEAGVHRRMGGEQLFAFLAQDVADADGDAGAAALRLADERDVVAEAVAAGEKDDRVGRERMRSADAPASADRCSATASTTAS